VKATHTLKTGAVAETCLPAGADVQMNEISKDENQKLSGEDTCRKFLHLGQLWLRFLGFNIALGTLGTVPGRVRLGGICLPCFIMEAGVVEAVGFCWPLRWR